MAGSRLSGALCRLGLRGRGASTNGRPERDGNGRWHGDPTRVHVGVRFEPDTVVVPAGGAVWITFECRGPQSPRAVVFPELGRMVTLPPRGEVTVQLNPEPGRTYRFECTGGAPRGTLIVEDRP